MIRPGRCALGGLLQAADLLLQTPALSQLEGLLPLEIHQPGGKITALNIDICPVQGQNMVDAAVQKAAVVGDQKKSPLPLQVGGHQGPARRVQVVGGLVDEQEPPLV